MPEWKRIRAARNTVAFHDCPMPGRNEIKMILPPQVLALFNVETVVDKTIQINMS
jgi:hypothetical protein